MSNLETIFHIWNIIVKSNTFNFIIFAAIFVWIFKKIDIKNIINTLQQKIIKLINDAKKEKEEAQKALKNAQKAIKNLPKELEEITQDAVKSADVIKEKILSEAHKQIESIESNAKKVIDAEEKLLIAKLTKNTSLTSVDEAKKHIQDALIKDPALQEKYIDESIDELDRLNF